MRTKLYWMVLFLSTVATVDAQAPKKINSGLPAPGKIWSPERADAWYKEHKWMTGANYIPATAINQLEMWQAETFDAVTIDREPGWAQNIGFNTMRVFLHHIAWDAPVAHGGQPIEWFHDIFKRDGTPHRDDEVNLIKKLNGLK